MTQTALSKVAWVLLGGLIALGVVVVAVGTVAARSFVIEECVITPQSAEGVSPTLSPRGEANDRYSPGESYRRTSNRSCLPCDVLVVRQLRPPFPERVRYEIVGPCEGGG